MSDHWWISTDEFRTTETGNDIGEAEELEELAEGFTGYLTLDFQWYVQKVADRLLNIHQARGIHGEFVFSLTCNSEGEIDGGEVCLSIPDSMFYLTRSLEWKQLTDDREAVDMPGLLAIKDALMHEYDALRRYAIEKGLI